MQHNEWERDPLKFVVLDPCFVGTQRFSDSVSVIASDNHMAWSSVRHADAGAGGELGSVLLNALPENACDAPALEGEGEAGGPRDLTGGRASLLIQAQPEGNAPNWMGWLVKRMPQQCL
jgi:hypothetical protein